MGFLLIIPYSPLSVVFWIPLYCDVCVCGMCDGRLDVKRVLFEDRRNKGQCSRRGCDDLDEVELGDSVVDDTTFETKSTVALS